MRMASWHGAQVKRGSRVSVEGLTAEVITSPLFERQLDVCRGVHPGEADGVDKVMAELAMEPMRLLNFPWPLLDTPWLGVVSSGRMYMTTNVVQQYRRGRTPAAVQVLLVALTGPDIPTVDALADEIAFDISE